MSRNRSACSVCSNRQLADRAWIMGDAYTIADIATFPWISNLIGFYEAGDLVGIADFAHVRRALDSFMARPGGGPRSRRTPAGQVAPRLSGAHAKHRADQAARLSRRLTAACSSLISSICRGGRHTRQTPARPRSIVPSNPPNLLKNGCVCQSAISQWDETAQTAASGRRRYRDFPQHHEHAARLEAVKVPAHQCVQQQEIERCDAAGGEGQSAMSPAQAET